VARFESEGLDALIDEIGGLAEEAGGAADEALKAGADVVVEAWKTAIDEFGLVDTGAMRDSVAAKGPKADGNARKVDIYPLGKDSHGVRNAEKAFVLNYGRSNLKATNFVNKAEADAEEKALAAMQAAWNARTTK